MIVYVVIDESDYESSLVLRIFSTEALALAHIQSRPPNPYYTEQLTIQRWEIDSDKDGANEEPPIVPVPFSFYRMEIFTGTGMKEPKTELHPPNDDNCLITVPVMVNGQTDSTLIRVGSPHGYEHARVICNQKRAEWLREFIPDHPWLVETAFQIPESPPQASNPLAGILEEKKMEDWQPIETAPKADLEGVVPFGHRHEEVLLWFPGNHQAVAYWDPYYMEGGSGFTDGIAWVEATSGEVVSEHHGKPTHWRPLPPPPFGAAP